MCAKDKVFSGAQVRAVHAMEADLQGGGGRGGAQPAEPVQVRACGLIPSVGHYFHGARLSPCMSRLLTLMFLMPLLHLAHSQPTADALQKMAPRLGSRARHWPRMCPARIAAPGQRWAPGQSWAPGLSW